MLFTMTKAWVTLIFSARYCLPKYRTAQNKKFSFKDCLPKYRTAQNKKFSFKDFFRKCGQILHEKLHFLWSAVHKGKGSDGIVKLQNCYLRSV